jgi:hypothetical protein
LIFCVATSGLANEPLRYKFTPGTTLKYVLTQGMTMEMALPAPAGNVTTVTSQKMMMDMITDEAVADGAVKQRHIITRAVITTKSEGGPMPQESEYDSDSQEAPVGPVAQLLDKTMKPMIGKPFSLTISPRGEVSDVTVAKGLLDGLKGNPAAAMMGEMGTEAGLKKLTTQSMIVFPETAWAIGDVVETPIEVKMPFGTMKTTRVMRYEGPAEGDLERMSLSTKTEFIPLPNSPAKITIGEEESAGEYLFDRKAGRLESSKLKQTLNLEIAVGPQTIQQTIINDVSFVLDQGEAGRESSEQ